MKACLFWLELLVLPNEIFAAPLSQNLPLHPKLQFSNKIYFPVFTNHGSYGTVPREVFEKRVQLLQTAEAHPDR